MSELAKLRWRCRRGMRELDALMLGWLDSHYANADDHDRTLFSELLEMQDPELMDLINGKATETNGTAKTFQRIIDQICNIAPR